jgi:hypothetical protein
MTRTWPPGSSAVLPRMRQVTFPTARQRFETLFMSVRLDFDVDSATGFPAASCAVDSESHMWHITSPGKYKLPL